MCCSPLGGGGGGGTVTPLTATFWVDPGRTTSTEDGSIAQPYKTPQAAYDQLVALGTNGTLLLATVQNGYSALPLVVSAVDVELVGYGGPASRPFLQSITISGGVRLSAENIGALDINVDPGTGATIELRNCFWIGSQFQDCTITRIEDCEGVAINTVGAPGSVVLTEMINCRTGGVGTFGIPLASALLRDCILTGGANIDALVLVTTDVVGAGADAVTCTTLTTDTFSLNSLRQTGTTHSIGTLTISDTPFFPGVAFAVPVLAANMADVTAALVGAKPSDTFSIASLTRLAGVGIVDAWCAVDDVLTVRFFGTTAGGAVTLDVTQHPTSA